MIFDYTVFDTLMDSVFVLGKDHKVIYCNEIALSICGLTLRKVQKLKFTELFSFDEKIDWLENLENVKDPTNYREVHFKTSEGQEGAVQISCRSVMMGLEPHWIVYLRDVTLEDRLQKKYKAELGQKESYIEELKKAQAELENYNKNLEKMVEERTREVVRLNQQTKALLDSLHQGFLIFDKEGKCTEVSSKACADVLEGNPSGKSIWEVLRLPEKKVEGFKKWMGTCFDELLPFPDLAPLGPSSFPHSKNKIIALEYFPLRNESNKIEGIVVVASDITSLVEAKKQAEHEKEYSLMIIKLIKNKKEISNFVRDTQGLLSSLKKTLVKPTAEWSREELYRILHTVKGGTASFSVQKTAKLCHEAEQILSEYKSDASKERAESLRKKGQEIDTAFLEYVNDTKNILGDRVLSENRYIEMPVADLLQLVQQISFWSKGHDLAYHLLKSYVMEPIGSFFEPYKELIQSVAQKEGKQVEGLKLHNSSLPVLPEVYSPLLACLVHAFRNGIDHGIETPEKRKAAGKNEAGKMEVYFDLVKREQEVLQIRIVDDGGGIDATRIRKKLMEKGVSVSHESDEEVIQHIFDSEFSTRDVVTETSGRGVGMDAILISAKNLGGQAWVESTLGKGTTLFVEVPYVRETPAPTPPTSQRNLSKAA
jgi:two-component system, chemotaxis family, sensor kinase CheA